MTLDISQLELWAEADPWPEHKAIIHAWLQLDEKSRKAVVGSAFSGSLKFGTAGVRAVVGPGPARINSITVAQATWAVCQSLKKRKDNAGVALAFDGRTHSRRLAEVAKSVVLSEGLALAWFEKPTATPVLAFAVRTLKTDAGIMITASHNPPEYNGFKLFDSEGVQAHAPWDAEVESLMAEAPLTLPKNMSASRLEHVQDRVESDYLEALIDMRTTAEQKSPIRVAYTAMHGVGERLVREVFHRAGYRRWVSVDAQAEPDGRFPTVAFPNPENPNALKLLRQLAIYSQADVAFANDPDADRLAVLIRDGRGGFQTLTGNEIGMLLCDAILRGTTAIAPRCIVTSHVSSPVIDAIAHFHSVRCLRTPTGFKWIASRGLEEQRAGRARFVFGFEEALGYLIGGERGAWNLDKDGVAAALTFADLVTDLYLRGQTVLEAMEALARRHGVWVSHTITHRYNETDLMARDLNQRMDVLRSSPPSRLLGQTLTINDFLEHETPMDMLQWSLEDGSRIMIRSSGTEPLMKFYCDVCQPIVPGLTYPEAQAQAMAKLGNIQKALNKFAR